MHGPRHRVRALAISIIQFIATMRLALAIHLAFGFGAAQALAAPKAPSRLGPEAGVAVHLFEWTWNDIAEECERFLGPAGYATVQISPPNEHVVLPELKHPWFQRYQPVSYRLESRGGTRAEFMQMVRRCASAGVGIYVDAVINHMAADRQVFMKARRPVAPRPKALSDRKRSGSAGSPYGHYQYPDWGFADFHHCGRYGDDDIRNYLDRWEVQNCELLNLADLATESQKVRQRLADYLLELGRLGVRGFRIDAAKHMPAGDVHAILSAVAAQGYRPYVFQEVIDYGTEPISAREYLGSGDVTEFKYGWNLGRVFKAGRLDWLNNNLPFGEGWGFLPSATAVVFVDNHDTQRSGWGEILTYKDGALYELVNVFMLAWPYGYPSVLSGYDWKDVAEGPPSNADGATKRVHGPSGLGCGGAWLCEHRRPAIAGMVGFRRAVGEAPLAHWWTNGGAQIAFARGGKGFIAINRDPTHWLEQRLPTGLPPGRYCDVVASGAPTGAKACRGSTIEVFPDGTASLRVPPLKAVAIHAGARVTGPRR